VIVPGVCEIAAPLGSLIPDPDDDVPPAPEVPKLPEVWLEPAPLLLVPPDVVELPPLVPNPPELVPEVEAPLGSLTDEPAAPPLELPDVPLEPELVPELAPELPPLVPPPLV